MLRRINGLYRTWQSLANIVTLYRLLMYGNWLAKEYFRYIELAFIMAQARRQQHGGV